MKTKLVLIAACTIPLASCAGWLDPPQSIGDLNTGYRYVPIDPLPVSFTNDFSRCPHQPGATPGLMNALPDLTTRVATEDVTGEASVTVPGVGVSGSGRSYRVTQDLIAYDMARLRFEVPAGLETDTTAPARTREASESLAQVRLLRADETPRSGANVITVPVYVGVGLRLTANLQIRSGKVNLSDLGAISAAVSANRARGSLVSQTLGLSSSKIVTIMPLPGELNATTILAATVAMAQIKGLFFDADSRPWPRVVGIHYPFARMNPALVNAIVGTLVDRPIHWTPCAVDGAGLTVG